MYYRINVSIFNYGLQQRFFQLVIFQNLGVRVLYAHCTKNGSIFDPNNFRGVSLINTVCKIFTNILVFRLEKWAENFNVTRISGWFRRKYSTVDNIFTLHAVVQKYLCKKVVDFIAYL